MGSSLWGEVFLSAPALPSSSALYIWQDLVKRKCHLYSVQCFQTFKKIPSTKESFKILFFPFPTPYEILIPEIYVCLYIVALLEGQ